MTATAAAPALRRFDDLPSAPGSLPLLGHLHRLDPARMHRILEDWHAQIRGPFRVAIGPRQVLVTADTDHLQAALRDRPATWRRFRQIEDCIAEIGGNGVFSVESARWSVQRRIVVGALNPTHLRSFFPTLRAVTARLHGRWAAAAARGEEVDMSKDLLRFTVDATTALAFGEDPNTIESDGDTIQRHLALVFPMLMARINAPLPYWRWVRLPRDRRFDRALTAIHAHIDGLIARARVRMREAPSAEPRNVLEALLCASDESDARLTDEEVRANVMTLLLAGEDTTAHTLAWTIHFLAQRASLQDALHAQAREALGNDPVCTSLDSLRRLDPFENAAIEATRLKPIVPIFFLEPRADTALGDLAVPAGTMVFFLLRPAMLEDSRFAAAATYDPMRWQHESRGERAHDVRAYVQFGAGPRVCPGRHLAGAEIRLVLSMLTRSFAFEHAVDPSSIREVMALAMMPDRMPVRLRARGG